MSDYVPPGLGRVLEDLITKHTGGGKPPTALEIHYRHAAETRRLMAAMQSQHPPEPAYPKRQPQDRSPKTCLLYTSPSPRDGLLSRMPSSA